MKRVGVYFQSWSSKWTKEPSKMDLAQIKAPVTVVYLSFASPGCTYFTGQQSFQNTGLNFSQDFWVVKDAIKLLKEKGILVMLSVGGGSYWSKPNTVYNAKSCVALMRDLGCDGIDLDWEVGVKYGYELTNAIKVTKPLLGKGILLSFAGWSTGAYGPRDGDQFQGMSIDAMTKQGGNVDWINIMTYDAGPMFDPIGALECYAIYYKGPLCIGFEVGTQAWGGALLRRDQATLWMKKTMERGKDYGMFVWSWQKDSEGKTPSTFDLVMMSTLY
jgi:chitinase